MTSHIRHRQGRRTAAVGAAATGVTILLSAGALAATTATASASSTIKASYKVSGSTYLAGPKASLALGPGTLSATVNESNGKLSATLSLPEATGSFTELGIQVTAATDFINDGPTTGKVNISTGAVSTTSKITLKIVSLSATVFGVTVPIPVGNRCETAEAVVVPLKSQKGFNILDGGKMAGSYTVGDFAHCGVATLLINQTIPASGNTITFTLGKAKIS
jgi:hypothetical protein